MEENKEIYKGEMLVQTVVIEGGRQEKVVYTKNSWIKDNNLYLDTEGAQIALKYKLEDIARFQEEGTISQEEATSLRNEIITLNAQMKAFQEWKKTNPNATSEEEIKVFKEIEGTEDETIKHLKEKDFNLAIRKLIAKNFQEKVTPLFKNIDSTTHFSITKSIMDRLFHLPELLGNTQATCISENQWEITSKFSNKDMGPIGLCHTFTAQNKEEAKKYLDNYKKWMREEGLKVLTAYWKTACEKNKFNYSSPLSEVMAKNSDDKRKSFFSVKERQRFWANTRKLENTKLTIELNLPKTKDKKAQKLILEHRLVDVGARMQNTNENTYPNNILVRVLNTDEFQHQSQIATAIHNNTLTLPTKDILLAISIQTRQAQTKDKKTNAFDEGFLIERANLQQTAHANKSKARSDLKKKLEKLKQSEIIKDYSSKEKDKKTHITKITPKKST